MLDDSVFDGEDIDLPNGWTIDLLASNKARGLARPHEVDEAVWDAIELPRREIASYTTSFQDQFVEQMAKAGPMPDDHKSQVIALMPLAMHELVKTLSSPRTKDSVKSDVIKFVIDHSIGKPKQEIEHSGSLALEIRKQANEYIKNNSPTVTLEVDPIRLETEALAKRYNLENFKVGDKGGGSG